MNTDANERRQKPGSQEKQLWWHDRGSVSVNGVCRHKSHRETEKLISDSLKITFILALLLSKWLDKAA